MHSLQALYSAGNIIGPLLVRPFLVDYAPGEHGEEDISLQNQTNFSSSVDQFSPTSFEYMQIRQNNSQFSNGVTQNITGLGDICYPYAFVGIFDLIWAIYFLLIVLCSGCHIRSLSSALKNEEITCDKETEIRYKKESKSKKIIICGYLFVTNMLLMATEPILPDFGAVYVIRGFGWSVTKAALISSTYWTAHLIGRLTGVPLSICVSSRKLLTVSYLLTIAALVFLLMVIHFPDDLIWAGIIVAGFGVSYSYSSVLLWSSKQMTITGTVLALSICGSGIGFLGSNYIIATLLQVSSHLWVILTPLIAYTSSAVGSIAVGLYVWCYHRRLSEKRKEHLPEDDGFLGNNITDQHENKSA